MTVWAHTTECDTQCTAQLGRGEVPVCICGGSREVLHAVDLPARGDLEPIAAYNARVVQARLRAGFSNEDAYRGLINVDPLPADGTRDGDGVWQGGKWHADGPGGSGTGPAWDPSAMWRTHHAPGSAEERYSRTMRFEKYRAMQCLLHAIAEEPSDHMMADTPFQAQAREILAGMVRPRGPSQRSSDRATELEVLAVAYRLTSGVNPVDSPHVGQARALVVEALKAWERSHPPAPIDPLLGP